MYIVGAAIILVVLFAYRASTTWPGLFIVISGVPVYWFLRRRSGKPQQGSAPVVLSS
jgi:APA family basic amino acid/polyamine antiporter